MDDAVYDEYGMYIGLQVGFDPEDRENYDRQKLDAIEYNEDDAMDEGRKEKEVLQMPIFFHEDKYYPSEPITPVKRKKFAYAEQVLPNTKYNLGPLYTAATQFSTKRMSESSLERHHHRHGAEGIFASRTISRFSYRRSHSVLPLRSHNGRRVFVCLVCKKKFSKKKNLKLHKRFNLCKFVCRVCKKEFSMKNDMILHKRVNLCDQTFLNLEKMLENLNVQDKARDMAEISQEKEIEVI